MKVVSLLIKPSSSACNMACKYCFYHSLSKERKEQFKGMMSVSTAETVIDRAFEEAQLGVNFAFQGGEPLLSGLDFFEQFVRYAEEKNKQRHLRLSYSLQTNGLSLDEEFCAFFKQYGFLLGVSIDGARTIHDLNRRTRNNDDTFLQVMNNVRLLQKHNVDFNALCVVTNYNAVRAHKLYSFFKRHNIGYIQFIPALDEFNAVSQALSSDNYALFLKTIFDDWFVDFQAGNYISIRHIDNLVRQMQGYPPELCGANGQCNIQNVVESDGSVYPCDFYCLDDYCLGNLNTSTLLELHSTKSAQAFLKKELLPKSCIACDYKALCGSGCKRYFTTVRGETENRFCKAYKEYFDYAVPKIKGLLLNKGR